MSRTFGIEIEAYNVPMANVAAAINVAGVRCVVESYNHRTRGYWKVISDSSVRGGDGFEVVSPVLSGEDGLRQVRIVMDALRAAGAKVNATTGLHVHVGAADMDLRQIKNVAKNYIMFEEFFDAIMPASRRRNDNTYIRSNRFVFGGYDHQAAARAMCAIERCDSVDTVIRTVNPVECRYYKLNMTAFWRHKTIEFRQHSGTVDADKACNWIKLLLAFVEKAATSRLRPRKETTGELPAHVVFSQFFKLFGSKEFAPFYITRRKHFERGGQEA